MMRWLIGIGVIAMAIHGAFAADQTKTRPARPDPITAIRPLQELMAISTSMVGKDSLCTDATQPDQQIAVGQILAQAFAYQVDGRNVVTGRCETAGDGMCEVFIRHAKGEDVWEKHLVFRSIGGKADVATLQCRDAG
ncbi:hypothetical protein GCM10011611_23840 [Aliidongia dinghuensis]|uniref:Uncharacterized protein n=1 Tax=Aliidongia dinghuensis TaxID=1867774 RepID=A0A8J3E3L5_9PROT|nr:hypothetical protein [Aliidongia dinghuensis]GGF17280.1 hypothetical protein GCM10011611_23840 [Aliidongia dinghuensis]